MSKVKLSKDAVLNRLKGKAKGTPSTSKESTSTKLTSKEEAKAKRLGKKKDITGKATVGGSKKVSSSSGGGKRTAKVADILLKLEKALKNIGATIDSRLGRIVVAMDGIARVTNFYREGGLYTFCTASHKMTDRGTLGLESNIIGTKVPSMSFRVRSVHAKALMKAGLVEKGGDLMITGAFDKKKFQLGAIPVKNIPGLVDKNGEVSEAVLKKFHTFMKKTTI